MTQTTKQRQHIYSLNYKSTKARWNREAKAFSLSPELAGAVAENFEADCWATGRYCL